MKAFNQIALDTYAELGKEAGWTQAFKKGTKTPWQDLKLDEWGSWTRWHTCSYCGSRANEGYVRSAYVPF